MKVRALAKVRPTYFAKGLVSLNDNISLYSDIFQLQLNNDNNNNDNDNDNHNDNDNNYNNIQAVAHMIQGSPLGC